MKKQFAELFEKDWSKLPIVVAITFPVLALISIFGMGGILRGIELLGFGEIVPVWVLQLAVMSPWIAFLGLIILVIIGCIGLAIIDMAINKNFDEYKEAAMLWKRKDNDVELSNEIFNA